MRLSNLLAHPTEYNFKQVLTRMNVETMFGPEANFSTMLANTGIGHVSDIVHSANIEWSERGAQAVSGAAWTTLFTKKQIAVDRPFGFLIVDHPFPSTNIANDRFDQTPTILFAGTVNVLEDTLVFPSVQM